MCVFSKREITTQGVLYVLITVRVTILAKHMAAKQLPTPQLPQTMCLRRSLAHAKHGQAPDSLQLTVNHLEL